MRTFLHAHADWLSVVRLPGYAPELNPTEGVWANLKNGLGNLAARSVDDLARIVRTRLKRMQYCPDLINGFLAETGLVLQPTQSQQFNLSSTQSVSFGPNPKIVGEWAGNSTPLGVTCGRLPR
jgi:hypothetical protein